MRSPFLALVFAALTGALATTWWLRPTVQMEPSTPAPTVIARYVRLPAHGAPTRTSEPSPVASQPTAAAPQAAASALPQSNVRSAFEHEPRDAGAVAAEERLRELFADHSGQGVLRDVRCTHSVCKLEARWSPATHGAYDAALLRVAQGFSRDLTFESNGLLNSQALAMDIFVRREL